MIDTLIRTHLEGFAAQRILDVGPGYSPFSRTAAITTGAREITYLDFDQTVLDWQLQEARNAGLNAVAVTLRLDETGLGSLQGPFDIIHCQEVLEHLPNAPAVAAALRRLLSDSGRMIITVPSRVSERWLKFLNPAYMRNEPFGHVNEYDTRGLMALLTSAGLAPLVLIPTQPHYFIAHTWFYGSRMRSEPSSGRVLTGGVRGAIFSRLVRGSRWFIEKTGPLFWGRLLPRNYFVIAVIDTHHQPLP
jgi:SAM-dependent methyltransferase